MRVLYLNHTAEVSGAELSLLDLLAALGPEVQPRLAVPRGELTVAAAPLGIPVSSIHGTAGSLRLHPLHTPRALADMALAASQVHRAARVHGVEILHANSIRAGIVAALGRGSRPALVHVRDCLPPGALSTATLRLIAARASIVVANSAHTGRSVKAAAPEAHVEVVHNALDLRRWDPARIDREAARAGLGAAGERALLMGVVAQLTQWKGQHTAIAALEMLRDRGVDAHLLLIGEAKFTARATRFDNRAYVEGLHAQVDRAGLTDRVSWLGQRSDVRELIAALDVLLLPSEEEPFGRAVIEAMALCVPVLATAVGGPAEILEDGVQGRLLAPGDPAAWAGAAAELAERPALRAAMGAAGRERVLERFTIERHAAAMVELYRRVLA